MIHVYSTLIFTALCIPINEYSTIHLSTLLFQVFTNANNIAIKFSPMSDFSHGPELLQHINLAEELLCHKDAHIQILGTVSHCSPKWLYKVIILPTTFESSLCLNPHSYSRGSTIMMGIPAQTLSSHVLLNSSPCIIKSDTSPLPTPPSRHHVSSAVHCSDGLSVPSSFLTQGNFTAFLSSSAMHL